MRRAIELRFKTRRTEAAGESARWLDATDHKPAASKTLKAQIQPTVRFVIVSPRRAADRR